MTFAPKENLEQESLYNSIVKRLQESERTYKLISENISDMISIYLYNGEIVYASPSSTNLLGYEAKDLVNKNIYDYIYPDDRENVKLELYTSITMKKESVISSYRMIKKDKSYIWVETNSKPIYNSNKTLVNIQASTRDISERKRAMLSIKKAYDEVTAYQTALNNSAIIAYTNPEGVITEVNDKFCKISKYSKEELIGQTHRILNSGIHPKEFFSDLWDTISKGDVWKGEICNKNKEGGLHWLDTTILPFLDENKKPFQYLAIRFDITTQKEWREGVKGALEKEIELNELKNRFIATTSHEFKTPLTTIQSSIDILTDTIDQLSETLRPKYERHFGRINNAINRLTSLLDDILILGRLEAGRMPFRPVEVDITSLVRHVVKQHFSENPDGRQLLIHTEGNVKNISIDPVIFTHILVNLIGNAFKYSEGKKDPELNLKFGDTSFTMEVIDYGIGIPNQEREQIFSSFFRASNTFEIKGTGLGLVIAKQMVDIHGGTIRFESEENIKTVFTVKIPCSDMSFD
ncbi:MAG: PAS domain S-box protein [Leptospiraceae bacterium]|nr:PAS domain S-box protein [Leptospiraceae bacterium]